MSVSAVAARLPSGSMSRVAGVWICRNHKKSVGSATEADGGCLPLVNFAESC